MAEETLNAGIGAKVPKPKTVEVNEDTLRELINSNKALQEEVNVIKNSQATNQNNGGMLLTRARNHGTTLKVRKWNGKLFLGYENVGKPNRPEYVYREWNAQSREFTEFCNLILKDEKKPIKVNYIEWSRECEKLQWKMVKRIELDDHVIMQGLVYKKDFTDNGYGMVETTVQVPLEVIEKRCSYVVLNDEGEEMELPESAIG